MVALLALGALVGAPAAGAAPADERIFDLLRARADAGAPRAAAASASRAWPATPARLRAAARSAVAARQAPARVVVGLRSSADLAAVARRLRARGDRVDTVTPLSLLEVEARSPAGVAEQLAGDRRVAFVELARARTVTGGGEGEFAGNDPLTGRAYGWAFDRIKAAYALARAGGGSARRPIAVIDSGADLDHPDLKVARVHDIVAGETRPSDLSGHGTFVAGLAAAVPGNGIGLIGSGGTTPLIAVRVTTGDTVDSADLAKAVTWAVTHGARVVNLSVGGDGFSAAERRAFDLAYLRDALPVVAAGNMGAPEDRNPVQWPAAYVGGWRGGIGIGLSVAATDPSDRPAEFSTHNSTVSLAAPGSGSHGCNDGVFSTVPTGLATTFDDASGCRPPFGVFGPGGRWGYLSGTSMSAPLVTGVAAIVWKANRRLASEQVGHVLTRSARQTFGSRRWNSRTGSGVADAAAAWRLAQRYDTVAPRVRLSTVRRGTTRLRVRLSGVDRTLRGDERAGRATFSLYTSRNGRDFRRIAGPRRRPIARTLRLTRRPLWLQAMACDANLNCNVAERARLRRR